MLFTLSCFTWKNDDNTAYRHAYSTVVQQSLAGFKGGWYGNNMQFFSYIAFGK